MKTWSAMLLTALLLTTILVSCIIVRDSKIDNSNLFREDINGNKESGIDLDGECTQQIGDNNCQQEEK